MPKGGRGAGSKKSTAPSIPNEEESNVVFGDAKSAAKKAKKANIGGEGATSGGMGSQGGPRDESKKPDMRTLIGGASWTGKLPLNMLSEHCQKQKWAKPEYTMVRSDCPTMKM